MSHVAVLAASGPLSIVFSIVYDVLWVYFLLLIVRIVFDYVQLFNPQWRPRGAMLIVVEAIYTLTDPPLKFFRRFIPPLRIGSVALDLSFLFVIIGVQILMAVVRSFI
jgi:YggT family protein